jgi:uncharacterized integral membrane protein (TIGR00698 family)
MALLTLPHSPHQTSCPPLGSLVPGMLVVAAGVAAAVVAHGLVPQVGVLTWAVALGAVVANLNVLPRSAATGLKFATRKLLRVGVVLLGFSLSLGAIAALGFPVIALVVVTLFTTLLFTTWLGLRMGLGRPRSLLIATGFSICGASAVAGMEETAEADEDDVAVAIAMVTVCGSVAMILLPLLQSPLGLTDVQLGAWAGASVHEVGQVVAAASPAGAAAVAVAMVVKLTRVLLLAPVVAGASLLRRRELAREAGGAADVTPRQLPPLVPVFVVGFLLCSVVRTVGVIPDGLLGPIGQVQTLALGAALFGLGTGVKVSCLFRSSGPALLLSTVSTLMVAGVSLAGVLLLV